MVTFGSHLPSIEAGPDHVGQRHHHGRLRIEREHAEQNADRGRIRQQLHAALATGCLRIGSSFTGRFTTAANTPSAIDMYQTMS